MLPPGVPPDGSVLTLSSRLMQYVNPSRMDVPFSVILDEDKILDDVRGDVFGRHVSPAKLPLPTFSRLWKVLCGKPLFAFVTNVRFAHGMALQVGRSGL